jgi:RNA-binding protein YlmH
MDVREKLMIHAKDSNEKIFVGRICELAERAQQSQSLVYTDFLNPAELELTEIAINSYPALSYQAFGGYEGAERKIAAIYPTRCSWLEPEIELEAMKVIPKDKEAKLGHRDYLGALINLGIKRKVLGDIQVRKEFAYIIVKSNMSDFIKTSLTQVGNSTVKVEYVNLDEVDKKEEKYKKMVITVASLRLDSVVARAFQLSRGAAANFIRQGRVKVDHRVQSSASFELEPGQLISCQGRGRCTLLQMLGTTKRGRIKLEVGFPILKI